MSTISQYEQALQKLALDWYQLTTDLCSFIHFACLVQSAPVCHLHCLHSCSVTAFDALLHEFQVRNPCMYVQVNAAACVVGMLDYSTASLCLAHSTPYVYIKPGLSTDEPFTCSLLHRHGLGVKMPVDTYHSGPWDSYLEQALGLATSVYKYVIQPMTNLPAVSQHACQHLV